MIIMEKLNKLIDRAFEEVKSKLSKVLVSKWLVIFIAIQPILDFYIFFETSKNSLSSFSFSTVIRFLFMGAIAIWFWLDSSRLARKKIAIALTVISVYVLLHWLFSGLLYRGPGNFSWLGEIFYLARLSILLLMLCVSGRINLNKKQFEALIYSLIFLISGVIVSLNLIGKSLGSYTHQFTSITIFNWRFDPSQNSFLRSATKGVFMYANQVSSILVFLLPLAISYYFKKPTMIKFMAIFMTVLAGLMLGTRVAAIGLIIIVLISLASYVVFNRDRVKKMTWWLSTLVVGWALSFGMSPVIMRQYANNDNKDPQDSHTRQIIKNLAEVEKTNNRDLLAEFIGNNYKAMSISHETITINYSYKKDPVFWASIFKEPLECRIDNRCIQDKIAGRIASKDVTKQSFGMSIALKMFGTGYTRADSLFPIEKDFLSHYRNLGFCGMFIFTAIYIVLLGLAMANFVCVKKDQRLEATLITVSIGMLVVVAYMSGNTLDSLFVMLIACFVMGQYIRDFKNNLQWSKIKTYLNKTQTNQLGVIKNIRGVLNKNNSPSLIITANPETFEKALSDPQFDKIIIDKNTIITPDGIGVVVASRLFGKKIKERVSGVELTQELLEFANKNRLKVSSLGATDEVASDFKKYLKNNYPKLKIGAIISGYGKDRQVDIQTIVKLKSQVVLFALGSGVQEKVAKNYLDQAKKGIGIGVGGTLDALTGRVKRAPGWAIRFNIEWLYRVIKQPKRIVRLFRYNGKFLMRILALYVIKIISFSEE